MDEEYDEYQATEEEHKEDDLDAAVENDEMSSAEAGYQKGAEEYENTEDEYDEGEEEEDKKK